MISVCIATYNGERYIKDQLVSIIKQLGPNDEIIISDDGSTDNTLKIIKDFNDNRIVVINNQTKHGYTPNFQNAIIHAKGDIIFLSDQDDVWLDEKVTECLNILEEYDMIVSDAIVTDGNLNTIFPSYWAIRKSFYSSFGNIIKCGHLGCCVAFKSKILHKILPFPSKHKLCPHDLWIIMCGLFYYKTKFYKKPLIMYRRHGNNVSNAGLKNHHSLYFKIHYRVYTLYSLIKRI